jgi:hypothetical protein
MNPIFLFESVETATLTASAGSAAGYGTENLQDRIWSTLWQAAATTQNQTLLIEYAAAITMDALLIADSNLASLGLTSLLVEAYVAGNYTTVLTLTSFASEPLYNELSAAVSTTKLRFTMQKGSALSIAPQIGLIFAGKKISTLALENGGQRGFESSASVRTAVNGQRRGVSTAADREKFQFNFLSKRVVDEAEWFRLVRGANGMEKPFWYRDFDGNWHFVRFDNNYIPSVNNGNFNFKTDSVEMSEERVGFTTALPGGYEV